MNGNTDQQNLIPLTEGHIDGVSQPLCNARDLHAFLEVGKDFSNWIKDRIEQYNFVENQDFIIDSPILANQTGRGGDRRSKEYLLTLDMAKELSMVERNEKGKQARRYFIECERIALEHLRKAQRPARRQPLPHPDPARETLASILGPFFSIPDDDLHFFDKDLKGVLSQFRAALRLAREIAAYQPDAGEPEIVASAINATANITGVDLALLFRGRPLHVDSIHDQFLSATQLGIRFGLTPPAASLNAHLVAMGLQQRGAGAVLYTPTTAGMPYAEFRNFALPDGQIRTHLFWRPSVIPLLQEYFAALDADG